MCLHVLGHAVYKLLLPEPTNSERRAFIPEVKFGVSSGKDSSVLQCRRSELDTHVALVVVVGCINQHKCLYSVPATTEETVVVFHF